MSIEYVGSDGSQWTLTGGGPGVQLYTAPLGAVIPDISCPPDEAPGWEPLGEISTSRPAEATDFPHNCGLAASGVWIHYTPTKCMSCGKWMQAGDRVVDRAMGAYFIHARCADGRGKA